MVPLSVIFTFDNKMLNVCFIFTFNMVETWVYFVNIVWGGGEELSCDTVTGTVLAVI